MSHSAPPTPAGRNEQHRCMHCGSRYEVWHRTDAVAEADHVEAVVKCPCCGGERTLNVPRGAEKDLRVEALPGAEPDTGVGD